MGDRKSALQCYLEGNELFKTGNFSIAVDVYSSGIHEIFDGLTTSELELQTKLLLNRAQCNLNMREYIGAVEDCSSVISIDSSCIKAFVRRAIAYENLGSFQKGLSDAEFATSLHPSASLLDTIVKLSSRLRALARCDAIALAAEGRPDRMVTDKQVLRLNFLRTIPRTAAVGVTFQARLCIGNEFGLWDRSFLTRNTNEVQKNEIIGSHSADQTLSLSARSSSDKIRVRVTILQLDEDQIDVSPELSMFSSLTLDSKEENQIIGDDGKVTLNLTFKYENQCGRECSSSSSSSSSGRSTECFVVLRFYLTSSLPSGASIVPIISLPFRVTCSTNGTVPSKSEESVLEQRVREDGSLHCKSDEIRRSAIMNIGESTCASCIRESKVGDVTVYVLESPGLLGIGGKVWDSTFVLVDFLRKKGQTFISGKRVVELGSGTGISGLGLCNFNPKSVILTDFAEVVPLIQSNIQLNCLMVKNRSHKNCLLSQYFAAPLCWGTELGLVDQVNDAAGVGGSNSVTATDEGMLSAAKGLSFECDLVIASDVVYDPIGYEPLVQTLCELLKGKYRKPSRDACVSVDRGADSSSLSNASSSSVSLPGGVQSTHVNNESPFQSQSVPLLSCSPRPICILAHRHRHPENQRFFDSLKSQEGIIVEMISRETGATRSETDIGTKNDLGLLTSTEKSISSETLSAEDGGSSVDKKLISSTVLSDVELYKISFK